MRTRARAAAAAVLAVAGGLAASAPASAAGDPIMPLSEVQPGMVGEARTVVQGTEIVTFPVRVLDVQRSFDGPGGSLVLARAEGPLMEQTGGVAEGMSGSPVYVTGADGVPRVIGAIAYGTGDQANVIAGITPIEQMIDSSSGHRANEVAPRAARRAQRVADRAAARALERRDPSRIGVYPLARWALSGVSRPLVGPLARELQRSGITLSSVGPRTPRPEVPLVPGASMTAMLAGGDLTLGAVGTVTYVDGTTVLGFGHPFLSAGASRFLLGDGYVYQTIPAPIAGGSYKLAEPGNLRGMVIRDSSDGLTGRLGPVDGISATATAVDTGRGTRSVVQAVLAPDERTAPIVGGLLQDEPAFRVRDGVGGGTLTLHVSITSPDLPQPVRYRNVYAAAGDVASLASGEVPRIMAILMQNGVRSVRITSLSVSETLEPRIRAARIVGASVEPRKARPGSRATLVLRVQPWRGAARPVRVPFRVPAGGGKVTTVRVIPSSTDGFDPLPADLTQDLGASTGLAARTKAVTAAERAARRQSGTRLERLVAGMRRTLEPRHDAVRVLGPGEDPEDPEAGATVPVPWVIYGGRAVVR
ncbi:MAG: SpoIVB peptidase S55 domain-containing protein, partial [Thermoleophilia bacterium]